ncbi:MAG: major capsid protein [Sporomusaceae bacterium]|nr:major capsid protein [Sporomusaceae bacterium]
MPTIFDLINPTEIATYWQGVASNAIPYLGEILFPAQKKAGLTLSWIKGSQGLPVALMPAEFDADAPIRERIGVSRIETEMAFFRERMVIKEKDRQDLLQALAAQNGAMLNTLIKPIYDDAGNLVNGVEVQAERMRMQLLSTGKIGIEANRVKYDYNYKFKASHKISLTGTAKWSDTVNSKPVKDIMDAQQLAEDDTGNRPTRAICTRKTWGYLLENESIKKDMNVQNGQNIILTDNMLQQYFINKLGLTITVYTKKFALTVNGSSQQFFPDDVFTLLPSGNLGNTYYGTTPEEADLMTGNSKVQVKIVNTGVAVTSYLKEHPVNVVTVVSAITLPSFEAADSVIIMNVA